MTHDYAHTAHAQANRRRKADALLAAALWLGCTELEDLDDEDQRHAVLAHAHLTDPTVPARASAETWALVRSLRAGTRVHRLPAGAPAPACGCRPHPVTRVLYATMVALPGSGAARSGWLCPHEDYRQAPPELEAEQPTLALAGFDDGSSPDWDALVPADWASMYGPGARP